MLEPRLRGLLRLIDELEGWPTITRVPGAPPSIGLPAARGAVRAGEGRAPPRSAIPTPSATFQDINVLNERNVHYDRSS